MSMVFFLSDDGETKISLDSESTINIELPSTVTKSSVMSGSSVSDEVIEGNITISVQGIVTYAKMTAQLDNLNPIDFQKAIQDARRNRRKFTLFIKDYGQPLLEDYENCVLANASVVVSKYSDSITVNLTFEQVFVSSVAEVTNLVPLSSEEAKPTTSSTTASGDATKTTIDEESSSTIFRAMYDNTAGSLIN